MSLHKEQTNKEVAGLKLHRLPVGEASQLSDAFVLGMRYAASLSEESFEEGNDDN